MRGEELRRAPGGQDLEAHLRKLARHGQHALLVVVVDADEHGPAGGDGVPGGGLRLREGDAEVLGDPHDFARRLHLRPQQDVAALQLEEREHGFLDEDAGDGEVLRDPLRGQRAAGHHACRDLGQGHARRLADEGGRARRARVHLEDVDDVVLDRVLHVHQALHLQGLPQLTRVAADGVEVLGGDLVGRQHHRAVAAVDARLLDVLQDAADDHALAVGDGIHVHFVGVLQEPVDEDRVLGRGQHGLAHVALEVGLVVGDGHGPAAQHVAGSHQHRIADARGHGLGLVQRGGGPALRLRDVQRGEQGAEALAVFGEVHRVRRGAQDLHARAEERKGQAQRRLPAELDDHAFRLLQLDDVHDVFEGEGLEVQPVGGVVVGGHRLRVAVDHDGLPPLLLEREGGVATAVVELDALADAVGPAAQDHDLPAVGGLRLALRLVGGVHVRRVRLELAGACIDTFVDGHDSSRDSTRADVRLARAPPYDLRDTRIRKPHPFRLP